MLRASRDPESTRLLAELREGAAAKPDELYQLLSWMNRNGLALLVLDWLPGLPPEITAAPPVCIPVAEARAHGMEWEKLNESLESGTWGAFDFMRLAYQARAMDRMDDADGAKEAWAAAMAAAGGSAQRLEELAKLALGWRW